MIKQKLPKLLSFFYNKTIDILAPPLCIYCKEFLSHHTILCKRCFALIIPIVSHTLSITKHCTMRVYALSHYEDPLRALILAKKRSDITASYQLGQLLCQDRYIQHMTIDYLIPIPLHWTRYAKRGYNQAQVMAQVLGTHKKVPSVSLIKRIKRTAYQSSLEHVQRVKNVQYAFALRAQEYLRYRNKHLVLVDDLMTTGATLHEAAKALTILQPASITAIVVCRVV